MLRTGLNHSCILFTQEQVVDDKQNALVLKNCSFSRTNLAEASKNGLRNVSLSIRKGELVGLLGGMASGKSTLVNLFSLCSYLHQRRPCLLCILTRFGVLVLNISTRLQGLKNNLMNEWMNAWMCLFIS